MPSLWKSGSVAGRAKPPHKSIRGTISAPIPIPPALVDDEFPIRTPGSMVASTVLDDEFPMRKPGTGIASTVPPVEPEIVSSHEHQEELKPNVHPQEQADEQDSEEAREVEEETEKEKMQDVELEHELEHPQPVPVAIPAIPVDVPKSTEVQQDIEPEAPLHPPPAPPSGSSATSIRGPVSRTPPQRASPRRGSPPEVSPHRTSSPLRASPPRSSPQRVMTSPLPRRATNPALSAVRYSVASEAPTSQSKDAPQRKKSTLRSALGRLFGRGRKKNNSAIQDSPVPARDSKPLGSSQHRSDPTAFSRVKETSPQRTASLPITEYDRPLRSHSIGPDDIMAIESARDSLQAEAAATVAGARSSISPVGRRRAATTTSRLFLQPRIRTDWGAGLSPRPASSHGRASRLGDSGEPEDPNEIGRAITSDAGHGLRRRSRSLSGLKDFIQPGGRRRSDEIRYWRESYDPGFMSPLSSNAPEDLDGPMDVSAPESPAVDRPPKTPPQPFNFGPITNDMVGMKITQAASIDTRIGDLEGRTHKLERVVDQLCHSVPGFRGPLGATSQGDLASRKGTQPSYAYSTSSPPPIPAIYRTISTDLKEGPPGSSSQRSLETDSHSQISFGEAPTFIGSLHPPSSSAAQSQSLTVTAPPTISLQDRPTSTSTVRGAASLPTMGRETGSGADDQYAMLAAQLETERAARQVLEAQVMKLSERLNTLSTTMFAMVRGPAESRSHERLAPPSIGGSSPLLQPPKTLVVPQQEALKALSVFETDDEEEEEEEREAEGKESPVKIVAESEDGFTEDDFQTPREDQPTFGYGAFGEELRPDDDDDTAADSDDPKRKKAARTLSLSQLTLGKGQRTQI
ncbi:hypothetical protein B0H63DRAFT_517789 [Podospora didyma]|uniref:Uncharacterized protein n=1 Tax=Podospora didyma TaxID=330526 RepID=A0AAE0P7F3_9PEZI|nr:hypothetical protein B0H63DRAFT_517789 [Podospora didyma]